MPVTNSPKPPKKDVNWGRLSKTLSFWLLILLIPVALIQLSGARSDQAPLISYTQYKQELDRDNIRKVKIQAGKNVTGEFKTPIPFDGRNVPRFNVRLPMENAQAEVDSLTKHSVVIEAEDARPSITAYIVNFLPWLLLIGFYLFLFRQMQAGGAKAFSFGKSKAKLLTGDTPKITFADVATHRSSPSWVAVCPRALFWLARRVRVRRCSRAPLPARQAGPSSRCRAPTSSRCSSALAHHECETFSSKGRPMPLASSSSTRSMPSAVIAAPVWAEGTTSVSKR
jgi:hypothetical protein